MNYILLFITCLYARLCLAQHQHQHIQQTNTISLHSLQKNFPFMLGFASRNLISLSTVLYLITLTQAQRTEQSKDKYLSRERGFFVKLLPIPQYWEVRHNLFTRNTGKLSTNIQKSPYCLEYKIIHQSKACNIPTKLNIFCPIISQRNRNIQPKKQPLRHSRFTNKYFSETLQPKYRCYGQGIFNITTNWMDVIKPKCYGKWKKINQISCNTTVAYNKALYVFI